MRAYTQSLLYQLVGQTLTILSSNQTGKVGKVEIYTENGELIFEQYKTLKLV